MICDLSQYSCIKISGPDAQTFLQGQLTCDMREITDEKASYAAYCNNKGRTIAVLRVIKHNDDYFLFTTGPFIQPCFKNLKKFGQFSKIDCTLESLNLNHFGFCGDDATKNLTELNIEIPETTNQVIQKDNYIIFKNTGDNNFELFYLIPAFAGMTANTAGMTAAPVIPDFSTLQQQSKTDTVIPDFSALHKQCRNMIRDLQPNDHAWQLSLIESLIPAITEETCEKFTPHMLGLKDLGAISFTKGCYIGQEIVARTEHLGKVKRTLQKAKLSDEIENIINQCQNTVLHIS